MRPVASAEYGAKALRPAYSLLADDKARSLGLKGCSEWTTALADYLAERAKGKSAI